MLGPIFNQKKNRVSFLDTLFSSPFQDDAQKLDLGTPLGSSSGQNCAPNRPSGAKRTKNSISPCHFGRTPVLTKSQQLMCRWDMLAFKRLFCRWRFAHFLFFLRFFVFCFIQHFYHLLKNKNFGNPPTVEPSDF